MLECANWWRAANGIVVMCMQRRSGGMGTGELGLTMDGLIAILSTGGARVGWLSVLRIGGLSIQVGPVKFL